MCPLELLCCLQNWVWSRLYHCSRVTGRESPYLLFLSLLNYTQNQLKRFDCYITVRMISCISFGRDSCQFINALEMTSYCFLFGVRCLIIYAHTLHRHKPHTTHTPSSHSTGTSLTLHTLHPHTTQAQASHYTHSIHTLHRHKPHTTPTHSTGTSLTLHTLHPHTPPTHSTLTLHTLHRHKPHTSTASLLTDELLSPTTTRGK